jgi:hypothetical protein
MGRSPPPLSDLPSSWIGGRVDAGEGEVGRPWRGDSMRWYGAPTTRSIRHASAQTAGSVAGAACVQRW